MKKFCSQLSFYHWFAQIKLSIVTFLEETYEFYKVVREIDDGLKPINPHMPLYKTIVERPTDNVKTLDDLDKH